MTRTGANLPIRSLANGKWQRLSAPERRRLREIVASVGWPQAAKQIGVSENTIRDLESGGLCRVDAVGRVIAGIAGLEKA